MEPKKEIAEPALEPKGAEADPGRRELRKGEVFCGICGYPAVVKRETAADGTVTETLEPHFGNH